jgi:sucrose phosphorylase
VKLELLPEIHDHYSTTQKLAKRGYWVYDFVLPMLILYTLVNQSSQKLEDYLRVCPRKQVTMLDCHDGIPVQPDLDDILTIPESKQIVELCLDRGANLNRVISDHLRESDFDAHQINITYYDALGRHDDAYLAARAIQFFAPGIPQVYYVGLLAGQNDQERFLQTGEGREVNRHNYSVDEIEAALEQKVVQRLLRLIRFRNSHPAFNGEMKIIDSAAAQVAVEWRKGAEYSRLLIDLVSFKAEILYSSRDGKSETYIV